MDNLPYAEDINYWKTGKSSPDVWIDKASKLITDFGGKVIAHAFGSDPSTGKQAYMIAFQINGDSFKVVWPVLPTYTGGDELAARRQAATMLHHEIKSRLISATVLGHRTAMFSYILLPDGRTASEVSDKEIVQGLPIFKEIGQNLITLKD